MEDLLTVREQRDGDVCILSPVGEVDMQTMRPLRETVQRLPDEGVLYIVFDLREVGLMDSAGMSVLFAAKKFMNEKHGECYVISKEGGFVAKSLETIAIDHVMPYFHDPEEALQDIEARRTGAAEGSQSERRAHFEAFMEEDDPTETASI